MWAFQTLLVSCMAALNMNGPSVAMQAPGNAGGQPGAAASATGFNHLPKFVNERSQYVSPYHSDSAVDGAMMSGAGGKKKPSHHHSHHPSPLMPNNQVMLSNIILHLNHTWRFQCVEKAYLLISEATVWSLGQ